MVRIVNISYLEVKPSFIFFNFSRSGDYVIGTKEKIEIAATVANGGEDAFNARFFLQVVHYTCLFSHKIHLIIMTT